ncbi:MAG: hypothetical protein ABI199_07625 [Bacteroidia bacterium]
MKKKVLFSLAISFLIILSSCRHSNDTFFSEGVIEYAATPVDQNNSMASLAPNKMTVEFKNNKSCAELSAGMGLFKMSIISDPKTMSVINLVKLVTKQFVHVSDSVEIKTEMGKSPQFIITETNETKLIAGYKCKRAIVSFADKKQPDFVVYYTNDIDIVKPNWDNPFHEIDGVLMEYQLKRYGLELKFTATSVTKKDIDDKDFEIPKGYKTMSAKEMDQLFQSLQ